MPSILFVCTANRFRSPLAAALLKEAIVQENGTASSWSVGSAGTWAVPGQPALPVVSAVAGELGLDLAGHRTSRVSGPLLEEHDLILVMQASQKEALESEFPELAERIYLFSNVVERGSYDIPDSFGSEQEVLELSLELRELVQRGRDRICVLARAIHNKRAWEK